MKRLFAPTNKDGYKAGHIHQYPTDARLTFANMTGRGSRVEGVDRVIKFGLSYAIQEYLIENWNQTFFSRPIEEVIAKYKRRLDTYLGPDKRHDSDALRAIHKLGYLPIEIWALPEGSYVNTKVPMFVMWNTRPDIMPDEIFAWVTCDLETILSCTLWLPCTSATTALQYRRLLQQAALRTNPEMIDFVQWQGHDFSMRGHGSLESAVTSGAAHLLSFTGTDTMPAIEFLEEYYGADAETELIGGSVPATEHSVMCMGGKETEIETYRRLLCDVYPKGILSIVSDTWDFWSVVDPNGGILTELKDVIMGRDGKAVIRPDSGDPVEVVCGMQIEDYTKDTPLFEDLGKYVASDVRDRIAEATPHGEHGEMESAEIVRYGAKYFKVEVELDWNRYDKQYYYIDGYRATSVTEVTLTAEQKGLIQCLDEIFGHTITSAGFKQLDPHIGAIYGDSITLARAGEICRRLEKKGYASTNLVYGIGSFTYQGAIDEKAIVTRDTYGFAVKATYGEMVNPDPSDPNDRIGVEIFKDPKTDSGLKKSAKGLIAVYEEPDGNFVMRDQVSWHDVKNCAFEQVFVNGKHVNRPTLKEIRERVAKHF